MSQFVGSVHGIIDLTAILNFGEPQPNSIEEVAIRGMALSEALYEILADKGILTCVEIIERIKKLRNETRVNLRRLN